jgi:hypothetical protein
LLTVCVIQAAAKIVSSQPARRLPIWLSTVRREFQDVGAALGLKVCVAQRQSNIN